MDKSERLFEFCRFAATCLDANLIYERLKSELSVYGVSWINYAFGTPNNLIFYSNMGEDWLTHYAQHYAASDYLVHHCMNHVDMLKFGPNYLDMGFVQNVDQTIFQANKVMFQDSWDMGVRGGLALPLDSKGNGSICGAGALFDLSEKDTCDAVQNHGEDIAILVQVAHAYISQNKLEPGEDVVSGRTGRRLSKRDMLTQREKDVLSFLAMGECPDRISEKMDIGLPTVYLHISKARKRLGSKTREQTIVDAMKTRQLIL